jgi:myo-inositol-1(or 4)-monophosphatase
MKEEKMDYREALDICKKAALAAGEIQKENFGRKNLLTETKSSEIDLVTEIDKKSEELIIGMIKEKYPEHGFIAEETGVSGKADYMWVIDPLDGTTNYSQGLPIFAVSIALQYLGETKLGVVYLPMTDQLFEAVTGEGAYINGERIEVSDKDSLASSVLATGFPYDVHTHKDNNVKYFNYSTFAVNVS